MLNVKMTPHLLGFEVIGDYDELNRLYDAVWELVGAEYEYDASLSEQDRIVRTRMLALCYDLRHAYQGSRNVRYVDNGMDRETAKYLGLGLPPLQNLQFSVEVLYPEAMWEVMVLGDLVENHLAKLVKKKSFSHYDTDDPRVAFDATCATVRLYQSLVLDAVRKQVSANTFSRIRKQAAEGVRRASGMYTQWLDILNCEWCEKPQAKRQSSLSATVRDISDYYGCEEYRELWSGINAYVRENGVSRDNVVPAGIEYPEDCEW